MVDDLKADSANYERSVATGATRGSPYLEEPAFGYQPPNKVIGSYQDSVFHQSRQHWGPSSSSAGAAATVPAVAPAAPHQQYGGGSSYASPSAGYNEAQPQQHQQQQAQPSYAPAPAGYSQGYQQAPAAYQTPSTGNSASPASSSYSNYTADRPPVHPPQASYSTSASSVAGYQFQGNAAGSVPRQSQTSYQQQSNPSYQQTGTQRYFGSFRPEFLVYN
jgi:hypothetical protein